MLIGGVTLHSALKFNLEGKHTSLTDKKREEMRGLYKNIKAVIVDEFSMMKPEILYRMDLRLREIKQNNRDFGGVAIFLFGDILQVHLKCLNYSNIKIFLIFEFVAPTCPRPPYISAAKMPRLPPCIWG